HRRAQRGERLGQTGPGDVRGAGPVERHLLRDPGRGRTDRGAHDRAGGDRPAQGPAATAGRGHRVRRGPRRPRSRAAAADLAACAGRATVRPPMRTGTLPSAAYDDVSYTRGGTVDRTDVGALVQSAADGDAAAWKAIVEGLGPLVWSVVRAHRLSEADAHEVSQTVWFRFAQHLGRLREPDK